MKYLIRIILRTISVIALHFLLLSPLVNAADPPKITQLKNLNLDTVLVDNNMPRVVIVAPANGRYSTDVESIKTALLEQTQVVISELPDTVDPEQILQTDNVIALGNSATNAFIKKLYRQWYVLLDLKYPGAGGYVVRSLHDPYGTSHNVIFVGGSDDQGVFDATEQFITYLSPQGGPTIGRLMDIQLSPSIVLPQIDVDIGRNLDSSKWNVFGWRDSWRQKDIGGITQTTGYEPATYFGWNPISIAGVLYYMTGQVEYLELFKEMAMPDFADIPAPNRTSEAFLDPMEPLVDNYHYLSHLVDCVYDLIEESSLFNDTERLIITNKLLAHQDKYDADNSEGEANGDRHNFWHLFNIYTGSRYFDKYYPTVTLPGHSWNDRIVKVRSFFNSVIDNPTWGERDTLEWVSTSTESYFDFFMMDGYDEFVSSGTAKIYMDALEVIRTGAYIDDSNANLTINLLHKAADMLGDGRYIWIRDELGFDLAQFRIGQSYWPDASVIVTAPIDLENTNVVHHLAQRDWDLSNAVLPEDKRTLPEESFQVLSYRSGLSENDDFLQIDGYYGKGRTPYHVNTLSKLRMFDGTMLLDGYESDVDIYYDGALGTLVSDSAALKNKMSAVGMSYLKTEAPNMAASKWQRHTFYQIDQSTIVIDTIVAEDQGEFDVTVSWEMGSDVASHTDSSRNVIARNGATLSLANGLNVSIDGNIVRQRFTDNLSMSEQLVVGNVLSHTDNQWTIHKVSEGDNAFLLNDSTVAPFTKRALVVVGNLTTAEFSVDADFAYFDNEKVVLANPTSFIYGGQEWVSAPQVNVELSIDMSDAINAMTVTDPDAVSSEPPLVANWMYEEQAQIQATITHLETSKFAPDGTLWVAGYGKDGYQVHQIAASDLQVLNTINPPSEPLSLWLPETPTQASAFKILVGYRDDYLRAYDAMSIATEIDKWSIKSEIDPSFIRGDGYEAPWFTDPNRQSGVHSILVGDLWGRGEEIAIGRPSTVEFHNLNGTALLGRIPTEWGNNSSLAMLDMGYVGNQNMLLVGKNFTGNPGLSAVNSSYLNITDYAFASLPAGYTRMHAWFQRGLSQLMVTDLETDGVEDVIYNLSGHWNELRVYNGSTGNLRWAKYLGPDDSQSDYMRSLEVLDLDGSGNKEIVIGTKTGLIIVYDNLGELHWKRKFNGEITELAILTTTTGDKRIVAGFNDGTVVLLDKDGNDLLVAQLGSSIETIATIGSQVFCGTKLGKLIKLDSGASPVVRVPPMYPQGLSAHWPLNETTSLVAPNTVNPFEFGTLHSNPDLAPLPVWAPLDGKDGALDLSGASDYVQVPNSETFAFDEQMTASMWIKVPTNPATQEIFLTKAEYAGGAWYGFYINLEPNRKLRLISNAQSSILYSADPIPLDEWVHVTVTIDKDNCTFYVNGELSNSVSSKSNYIISNSLDLFIGSYLNGKNNFNGSMDDVRIHNYALSSREVLELYALTAHWPMDEIDGVIASNVVNSSDSGVRTNNPLWSPSLGINGALQFMGGDTFSHVRVTDSPSLALTDELTVATWLYVTAYPDLDPGTWKIFLAKTDFANGAWHGFYLDLQPDGRVRLVSSAQILSTAAPIPTNVWVHVAVTIDQDAATLYINGEPSNSLPSNANYIIDNSRDLFIGAYQTTGFDFDGLMDEVRIYNHSLIGEEIIELYNFELSKNADDDGDGLSNYEEQCFDWDCLSYNPYDLITGIGTDLDKAEWDTDGDGVSDGDEMLSGTNPLDPASFSVPTDGDGDVNGDGQVDVMDLLLAMRILTGQYVPTPIEQARWDVAPLVGGVPAPDGKNDLSDYLVLSRKVMLLVDF